MGDRQVILGGLTIVAAQLSINIGAALAKGLFPLVGPEGVAALRTAISAAILLAVARPWRAALSTRQAGHLLLYGLAMGGMDLLIYWAIARIPIGVAVAVEISGPLAVVLLTSRSLRDFLWFALAAGSLLLLIPWPGREARLDPAGLLFALGAAACWALYIVFGKRASEVKGSVAVALGMLAACLVTLPAGIAAAGAKLLLAPALGIGVAVALLSSALPYMLEMNAFGKLSSRLIGVVSSCAPAVGALTGFAILGERLSFHQWIAVIAMITASAGCSLTSRAPLERPT